MIDLDTETYSENPISAGVPKYIEGKLEVMLVSYGFDDGPEQLWDRTKDKAMPGELRERLVESNEPVTFLNAQFDRTVLRTTGIIDLPCERIWDVMVQAYCHGLPGSMDKLCTIFGLSEEDAKFKDSKSLIHFFCKRNGGKRNTRLTHPEKWERFCDYAKRDIKTMRILRGKLPKWNYPGTNFPDAPSAEHKVWCLDQRINDRGFLVDQELARCAVTATTLEREDLAAQVFDNTCGEVGSATQRDELLKFIVEAYGVKLPDMRADTLQRRADDPDLPDALRELLALRIASSRNASAKYKTVLQSVSSDGRLRFTAQFAGAAITGRWAHRKFQPGNMMRPTMKATEIATAIDAIKSNVLDLCYDNAAEVLGNCVRGLIVAPPKRKLYVADLKSIEGRGLGYLAGDPIVDFYRDADAGLVTYDSYMKAYADCFGGNPADVTKTQRQIGKPIELACLTANTRVITSSGVKCLIDVELTDLLWDGEQWVPHQGVVDKGVRQIVDVDGIELTPDHLVRIHKTWQPAQQLVLSSSILFRALETGSESLKSLASSMAQPGASAWLKPDVAVELQTLCTDTISEKGNLLDATSVQKSQQALPKNFTGATPTSVPTPSTDADCSIGFQPLLAGVKTQTADRQTVTTNEVSGSALTGEVGLLDDENFSRMWSSLKVGTTPPWNLTDETTPSVTNRATCDSLPGKSTQETSVRSSSCKNTSTSLKPVYDIAHAGPRNRFTILSNNGAFVVHNCGYGGGVAAFITFALTYHVDLEAIRVSVWETGDRARLNECLKKYEWAKTHGYSGGLKPYMYAACEYIKQVWREARPETVAFWETVANGFRQATLFPDKTFTAGPVKFRRDGQWLRLRLPSGRNLIFLQPKVGEKGELSYMGHDRYTRKWCRQPTHGGKMSGIVTQAFARDILTDSLEPIEDDGFDTVLLIHDEVIAEGDEGRPIDDLIRHLIRPRDWAPGLPLAADGFITDRYRKD